MTPRPACYPPPPEALLAAGHADGVALLDALTSPVPEGRFDSPVDHRHVLCLHIGEPVPVTYRAGRVERSGVRLHGQFCVVPAGSSTRWTLTAPARSLLLRMPASLFREAAEALHQGDAADLAPAIHIRDPQVERIGWLMKTEADEGHPGGRLFADSLASALAVRLLSLSSSRPMAGQPTARHVLAPWRLQRVIEYIEANLADDLSLAALAGIAGYSVSHFKPLFQRATGVSVHQFVVSRRVERARLRLAEGASLADTAWETGFTDASHLARWTRRLLGASPSTLRGSLPSVVQPVVFQGQRDIETPDVS
ncbi:AraC family transcriptional regulator [Luteibacter sp. dw_328]|uniref:helix-turn-helix domain-containing protein n=1 Tax=Luteibacter sp. dw_328 TaxID=2719796 RepID=UPI001BD21710|nr:AraC family transcriptional regulator [Luteibacter sp. dw_328]